MTKIQMTKTATASRYDTASVSVINYSDLVFEVSAYLFRISCFEFHIFRFTGLVT